MQQIYFDNCDETTIQKIVIENELLKSKMSSLRRMFASLTIGIISGEEDVIQDDLQVIEEILTSD